MAPARASLTSTLKPSTLTHPGDLIVTCAQTGLTAALRIAKDGSVEGTVEQAAPKAPPAAGTGGAAPVAAAAAGAAQGPRQLGMFGGSWRNQVYVSCPAMVSVSSAARTIHGKSMPNAARFGRPPHV